MTNPKEKPLDPCQGEAAQKTNHIQNSNRPDALLQWHALGANAKSLQIKRQQKREWKRGRK